MARGDISFLRGSCGEASCVWPEIKAVVYLGGTIFCQVGKWLENLIVYGCQGDAELKGKDVSEFTASEEGCAPVGFAHQERFGFGRMAGGPPFIQVFYETAMRPCCHCQWFWRAVEVLGFIYLFCCVFIMVSCQDASPAHL